MKRAFLLLCLPVCGYGQILINDDFSDGDFTASQSWTGNATIFEVDANYELHLKDVMAGEAYLSTGSGIIDNSSWEFYVRMEFNPSGSNFAKVYVVSDHQDLLQPLNGYYVSVSGSSDDRISLYKQSGSNSTLIVESTDDWVDVNTVEVGIKVTRDSLGFWELYADTSGGTNYQLLGSGMENTHKASSFFGVVCTYTVTRSDLFFFDNFSLSGNAYVDLEAPTISKVELMNSNGINLIFSENMEELSAMDVGNYLLNNGMGLPDSATRDPDDGSKVKLFFGNNFINYTAYQLQVKGVEDLSGNMCVDTADFTYYIPTAGDVIINELMPDPEPVVGFPPNALPEREYIELYNKTAVDINLNAWFLDAGSSSAQLPAYVLPPKDYVILTIDEGAGEFDPVLPVVGLDISGSALLNSGTVISLKSPDKKIISTVLYSGDWYRDENKSNGGWSLERIDPENECGGSQNWRASIDASGGTPGAINSVNGKNPDVEAPEFERISIIGDSAVLLHFSEKVDEILTADVDNYQIFPVLPLDSAAAVAPYNDRVEVHFGKAMEKETIYTLSLLKYPEDCSGNTMLPDSLIFGIPSIPEEGDILINEILFNPKSGGSDFVEIYNNSKKILDLAKLHMGNVDPFLKTIVEAEAISDESFLLKPGGYLALSADPGFLKQNYTIENAANLRFTNALPSLPDDEGSIGLVTSDLHTVIDFLEYTDDMHLPMLKEDDGVSLERISFEESAQDDDNWQSAAATSGYATPGYVNSHYIMPGGNDVINIEPKVFSPNQDGYKDILSIGYNFADANNVVSVSIWSSAGFEVIRLQNNVNVSREGFFTWDGTGESGQLLNSGIYIVVVDYFNANGLHEVVRKTCVLSL